MQSEYTTQALERVSQAPVLPEAVEQALLQGDIAKMSAQHREAYYKAVCLSAGLNYLTRPFEALKGQDGTYKLYARKEAAEQLRKIYHVSIRTVSRERIGDLYIVTVEASMPNGRKEECQGIVSLTKVKKVQQGTWAKSGDPKFVPVLDENGDEVLIPLKGDALASAMMRCETKAKRRATLAICGLGFSEAGDTEFIDVTPVTPQIEYKGTANEAINNLFGDRDNRDDDQADESSDEPIDIDVDEYEDAEDMPTESEPEPSQGDPVAADKVRIIKDVVGMYDLIVNLTKEKYGEPRGREASCLLQAVFGERFNAKSKIPLAIAEMEPGSLNPLLFASCAIEMQKTGLPGMGIDDMTQWREAFDSWYAEREVRFIEAHTSKRVPEKLELEVEEE